MNNFSTEPLIKYFNDFMELTNQEQDLVNQFFKPRLYRKRQFLLQEGDVCKNFNFVIKGCLRTYKIDEKGNIHILQFASENWWANDNDSFHNNTPSELNIDAIEDTMVLQITRDDLITLYKKSRKFKK